MEVNPQSLFKSCTGSFFGKYTRSYHRTTESPTPPNPLPPHVCYQHRSRPPPASRCTPPTDLVRERSIRRRIPPPVCTWSSRRHPLHIPRRLYQSTRAAPPRILDAAAVKMDGQRPCDTNKTVPRSTRWSRLSSSNSPLDARLLPVLYSERLDLVRHTPSQRCKIERFDRIDRAEQREPFDDGETPHPGHHVRSMRIMAAAAALLLLLMLVSLAAAAPTNNTSDDTREREDRSVRESWRTFRKLKAEHGGNTDDGRSLTAKEEEERSYAWFKHRLGLIRHWWRDAGYSVFPWETGRCEEETRQLFAEWKVRHHKTYVSAAEDEHRYAIFKDTLRDVDQHNAGFVVGAHGYPLGVNEFSDITMEEFEESFSGGYIPELAARVAAGDGRVLAPSTVSPTATAVFA